jgi:phosphoglycolate phosphatase-like HAD superfamily hydrolase
MSRFFKDLFLNNIKSIVFDLEGTLVNTSFQGIELLPEVSEILVKLTELKIPLYIWTMRDRASTIQILKRLDLLHYFEDLRCLGSDNCGYKPNPEGIREMLAPGTNYNEVLVVGDSQNDILGGIKLGGIAIAALWYYSDQKSVQGKFLEIGARAEVRNPCEILNFL